VARTNALDIKDKSAKTTGIEFYEPIDNNHPSCQSAACYTVPFGAVNMDVKFIYFSQSYVP